MANEVQKLKAVQKASKISKIYNNSNIVKYFDGIIENESLGTLENYVSELKINFDNLNGDLSNLDKYDIVKLIPTTNLNDIENPNELYLILDENSHDIATFEPDAIKGSKIKMSPKIQEYTEKIIEKFNGQGKEILEDQYSITTIEELVKRLCIQEEIVLSSEEQAKDDINKKYKENGMPIFNKDNLQEEDEKKALEKISPELRGEAIEFARQRGIKIKEILIIDNPNQIAERIDNRQNQILKNGGPVLLMRTRHDGADEISDDVYTIQDGHVIQNECNDIILENVMDNHTDEGHVIDLDSDDDCTISEYEAQKILDNNAIIMKQIEAVIKESQKQIEIEEEKIAQIQYNIENFNIDDAQDSETIINQMQSEISNCESNIKNIIANRNNSLDKLRGRILDENLDEKLEKLNINTKEEKETNDDNDEYIRDRWEETNPYNRH